MKKIFVLAGGSDQVELIKGLRNRFPGVEIILIDMAENVVARQCADRHLVISTMDYEQVLAAAREEHIDLILCACGDQPLTTMAYVSEKLNLPCYLTFLQACNLTNKLLMKDLMILHGIPTSKYKIIKKNTSWNADGLQFPLVVKPVDNNGSKGISKVNNLDELDNAVITAQRYAVTGDLIVEEFKKGKEYSVEIFLEEELPQLVIATQNIKIKDNGGSFTILQNRYLPLIPKRIKTKILNVARQIGRAFDLKNAPLLIQLIVDGEDINVIEFSARTGGGSKLHLIREMSGVDVIDNLIDITIGKKPTLHIVHKREYAAINYIYTRPGVFSAIRNMDRMLENGIVFQSYCYKNPGTIINASKYSSDRPAGFFVKAHSVRDLKAKILDVDRSIEVIDCNGTDIMLHGLYDNAKN